MSSSMVFLGLLACVTGQVKRCYVCSHNRQDIPGLNIPSTHPSCEDPFKPNGVPHIECTKDCYKMKGTYEDFTFIYRGCGHIIPEGPCVNETFSHGGRTSHMTCCNGLMCNGCAALVATKITAMFIAMSLFIT